MCLLAGTAAAQQADPQAIADAPFAVGGSLKMQAFLNEGGLRVSRT